jgi:hypothetical protein
VQAAVTPSRVHDALETGPDVDHANVASVALVGSAGVCVSFTEILWALDLPAPAVAGRRFIASAIAAVARTAVLAGEGMEDPLRSEERSACFGRRRSNLTTGPDTAGGRTILKKGPSRKPAAVPMVGPARLANHPRSYT